MLKSPRPVEPVAIQILRWLPGLAMLVFGVAVLVAYHTPLPTVLGYGVAFAALVTVPGVLLLRALDLRPHTAPAAGGLGSAIGLIWQLPGWALAVTTHTAPWLLWVWSAVLVAVTLGIPSLRRRVLYRRGPLPVHRGAAWTLAGCFAALTVWFSGLFTATLPPADNHWHQDQYFHLAMTALFTRQVVPETPQVAGLPFTYHWFPNAHFAAMGLATGIDLPTIQVRLWVLPIVALVLGLLVLVAEQLTGHAEAAVVAALMLTFRGYVRTASWYWLPGDAPLAINSPSQTYSIVFWLVAIYFAVALLRREKLGALWAVGVAALLVQPGMKSSHLPLLLCGFALAGFIALLSRRGWRGPAIGLGLSLVALLTAGRVLGGGGAGAHFQLGSSIRRLPVWGAFVGLTDAEVNFPAGPVLPGLDAPGAVWLLLALAAAYVVKYLFVVFGFGPLARRDLAAWFLLGLGIAGFAAMMIVDQDGQSQAYFMSSGVVGWHLLFAWGLTELWSAAGTAPASWRWGAVGFGLLGVPLFDLMTNGPTAMPKAGVIRSIAAPALGVLVAAAAFAGVLVLLRRRRGRSASLVALALGSLLLVTSCMAGARSTLTPLHGTKLPAGAVTAAETQAAQWVRDHTPSSDVVATNVHCMASGQPEGCDARAFWVGAFTQRQMLVESWGYTDAAHQAHGRNGKSYATQPFADPQVFAENEAAFRAPTQAGLDTLRARGVRWLFADRHRATVAPELANLAEQVYSNDDVTVYRLG